MPQRASVSQQTPWPWMIGSPFRGDGDVTAAGYARVPCICIALWTMMRDPYTPHSGCLAGAPEQVSRRLSPRLSPNSSRSVLHTPSVSANNRTIFIDAHFLTPSFPLIHLPFRALSMHSPSSQCHHSRIARQSEGRTVRKVLSYHDTSLSDSERV